MEKTETGGGVTDSITNQVLSENQKLFLDISLKDYQEIRTELREVIARQNTVLFSSIAQFATLVGLGLTVLSTDYISDAMLWASNIFCVLIPCISILLGVIWIDLAYRQIMMGAYVYSIESQVVALLHASNCATEARKVLYWEHRNHKKKKIDILSYLCSMILYVVFPVLCFLVFLYYSNWKWMNSYFITVALFVVCVSFILSYCLTILKIYKSKAQGETT